MLSFGLLFEYGFEFLKFTFLQYMLLANGSDLHTQTELRLIMIIIFIMIIT
jgi:hypothetical protein